MTLRVEQPAVQTRAEPVEPASARAEPAEPASARPEPASAPPALTRAEIEVFRFLDYDFDATTGTARLHYAFNCGPVFEETFVFPLPANGIDSRRLDAVDRALRDLHLVAGMSYYKAFVPTQIAIENYRIDAETAALMSWVYLHGLAELAYRNRLDLTDRIRLPANGEADGPFATLPLARQSLVLVGGGKDSLVTIEALRAIDEPMTLLAVRPASPIRDVIDRTGLPSLVVERQLSPHLFALNAAGAYNGHVAITAILSMVSAVVAALYGYDAIILSNERSASIGNLVHLGREVNHQFSKSLTFESMLAEHLTRRLPGVQYFSLLRPLSELAICQLFARSDRYDDVFTSCNAAFKLSGGSDRRWCCDCPKCRFVFLALAPFLEKSRLLAIFGENLLDDPGQLAGYEELTGLERHKPFECVGEVAESATAMSELYQRLPWRDACVVSTLGERLQPHRTDLIAQWQLALAPSTTHRLQLRYEECLHAFVGAS